VDAGDALAIINYINAFGSREVSEDEEIGLPFGYLDVNHDNFIAPDDALTIINGINAGLTGGPEGEAPTERSASDASTDLDALISLMAVEMSESSQSRRRFK
jgi:hypothetical protein